MMPFERLHVLRVGTDVGTVSYVPDHDRSGGCAIGLPELQTGDSELALKYSVPLWAIRP